MCQRWRDQAGMGGGGGPGNSGAAAGSCAAAALLQPQVDKGCSSLSPCSSHNPSSLLATLRRLLAPPLLRGCRREGAQALLAAGRDIPWQRLRTYARRSAAAPPGSSDGGGSALRCQG